MDPNNQSHQSKQSYLDYQNEAPVHGTEASAPMQQQQQQLQQQGVQEADDLPGTGREVGGAAVLGAVAGLVLGGPILGLVAAGGAAAVATSNGKAGHVTRKGGEMVADAGDRLRRFDQKHRVVEKTSTRLRNFDQKHRVVEKTSRGIKSGCKWVSKQFDSSKKPAPVDHTKELS